MIIVYHHRQRVHSIFDHKRQMAIPVKEKGILKTLMELASQFEDQILVWCSLECQELLNHEAIMDAFKIKNTMVSYGNGFYLPDAIGYVEDSPFINVNSTVKYPTWFMHTSIGAIYGSTLLKFKDINFSDDFAYDLNSLAKLGMPNGLFCYSDPNLLNHLTSTLEKRDGFFTLFRFVKQHYRMRWVFLLALNFLWHERQLTLLPLLNSLFYKKRHFKLSIPIEATGREPKLGMPSIDVIIPTIGRASYLHTVLIDLAKQTHVPNQVIIIEQNPDPKSGTALDFIYSESWPFKIEHQLIHQTGACNARNLALKKVNAAYVFMADDDITFPSDLLKSSIDSMILLGVKAATLSCLQKSETEKTLQGMQWHTFGAGCSIVTSDILKNVAFDMAYEHGFGEDGDFGMQLRNLGADIIYLPHIKILHLKAPIGGFRSTFKQPWLNDTVQPKPSPTVMLNVKSNKTKWQFLGYKTTLCINYYFAQEVKNPLSYFKKYKKQWERSVHWANQLKTDNRT